MSLSTRESTCQARENMLMAREAALVERETRILERENRQLAKEKWAAELLEREKLIHERERLVHEREQRMLIREQQEKMDFESFRERQSRSQTLNDLTIAYEISHQSPPRRPLQENKFVPFRSMLISVSIGQTCFATNLCQHK